MMTMWAVLLVVVLGVGVVDVVVDNAAGGVVVCC